jgi:hypothetical protein
MPLRNNRSVVTNFFFVSSAKGTQALHRDGYCCVITGLYDSSPESVRNLNITAEQIIAAGGAWATHCAHIVPDSIYLNVINSFDEVWQLLVF